MAVKRRERTSGAAGRRLRVAFERALDELVKLDAIAEGFGEHVVEHGLTYDSVISYATIAGRRHQRRGSVARDDQEDLQAMGLQRNAAGELEDLEP